MRIALCSVDSPVLLMAVPRLTLAGTPKASLALLLLCRPEGPGGLARQPLPEGLQMRERRSRSSGFLGRRGSMDLGLMVVLSQLLLILQALG